MKSLLVVLGPSGAGKSSFLRAGLLPRLRREDRRFLPLGIVRPQRLPLIAQTCSLAVAELRCHRCGVPDGISMAVPKTRVADYSIPPALRGRPYASCLEWR